MASPSSSFTHAMPTRLDELKSTCPDGPEPMDPHALEDLASSAQLESERSATTLHDDSRRWRKIHPTVFLDDDDEDKMCRDPLVRPRYKRIYVWQSGLPSLRPIAGAFISFAVIPAVYSAWTMSRGFRVASGMTSTMAAIAVVPLRTASHVPQAAWIATYVAWALCFSIYVWLQLVNIPHRPHDKRTIYIFTVAMASLHFTIGLSQGAESIAEGAALFAPIVSTASAYLMSLLITINWREAGLVVYELA